MQIACAGFLSVFVVTVTVTGAVGFRTTDAFFAVSFGLDDISGGKSHHQNDHTNGDPGFNSHRFLSLLADSVGFAGLFAAPQAQSRNDARHDEYGDTTPKGRLQAQCSRLRQQRADGID